MAIHVGIRRLRPLEAELGWLVTEVGECVGNPWWLKNTFDLNDILFEIRDFQKLISEII